MSWEWIFRSAKLILAIGLVALSSACQARAAGSDISVPREEGSTHEFSTSGAVLVARWNEQERRHEILPVDPLTGHPVDGYDPISVSGREWHDSTLSNAPSFSRVSDYLAVIEPRGKFSKPYARGTMRLPSSDLLHVVDLGTWRKVGLISLPGGGRADPVSVSPDGTHIALAYEDLHSTSLMVFDVARSELVANRQLNFMPSLIAYTPDLEGLILFGTPPGEAKGWSRPDPPGVLLVDSVTLDSHWQRELTDVVSGTWCAEGCELKHGWQLFADWRPAVVLSANGWRLIVVHPDKDRMSVVDVQNKSVTQLEIEPAKTWFEKLLGLTADVAYAKGGRRGAWKSATVSLDGDTLYVTGWTMTATQTDDGYWETTESPLGLHVIQLETGEVARSVSRDGGLTRVYAIEIAPDSQHLIIQSWNGMEVIDLESLDVVGGLRERWMFDVVEGLDGQGALVGTRYGENTNELGIVDLSTLELAFSWTAESQQRWVMDR